MSTPVPLRSDFDTIGLRMLARRSRDPDQARRLLALAEIYNGGSRPDAVRIGGVGVQIVRDWVVRPRFEQRRCPPKLQGRAAGVGTASIRSNVSSLEPSGSQLSVCSLSPLRIRA